MKKLIATIVVAVCAAFGASAAMVDLANAAADATLANGDVAYGTLSGNYKVSIAETGKARRFFRLRAEKL